MELTKEQRKAVAESLAKMSSADLIALRNLNNTFMPNLKRLKKKENKSKRRK